MTSSDTPTIFYDAKCGVCSALVRRAADHYPKVSFIPSSQLPDSTNNFTGPADREILLVTNNQVEGGIDAVRSLLRTGPRGSRATAYILGLPIIHGLADLVYRLIANNRPRISRWLRLKPESPN